MRTGCLIVISGPSGAGKGTVCSEFLRACPEVAYSISATTRAPREGEQEGVNYYFLDRAAFERMIADGELLEWAEVYGNYYGTPLKKIEEKLAAGTDILLEIDTQGALNVMKNSRRESTYSFCRRRWKNWKNGSGGAARIPRRSLRAGWLRRRGKSPSRRNTLIRS